MDYGGEMGGGPAPSSGTKTILEHGRHEMASLPIPDEILAEIFLRINPADLVRACLSFRGVAADRSLLRRYRKIHAPPILGFLDYEGKVFHPTAPPHPSPPEASAADFSFSFLPAHARDWVVHDTRDRRVLLYSAAAAELIVCPELVMCDPLHRRYVLLPPITYDAVVEDPLWVETMYCTDMFRVSPDDGDEAAAAEETSFRVVWMALCKTRLAAFVFSSNTGQWRAIPSQRWSGLFAGLPPLGVTGLIYSCQYVGGCFYWLIDYREEIELQVLDTKAMEFSIVEPPPEANGARDLAMVEAGERRTGMFVLADSASDLNYFIRQNDGGSSSQWQKVKTISLGSGTYLLCSMKKYLLLYQGQTSLLEAGYFTLNIETFQLEKMWALGSSYYKLQAYSNFPPSLLSSQTISCGTCKPAEKAMR